MSNPFLASSSKAGNGEIYLALLPPDTPRIKTASYQYPLKLVSPLPSRLPDEKLVHTIYLLTYGGGIVAGDAINLNVTLEATTRLVLLTQGSTKLFKSPSRDVMSRQTMRVSLSPGSALCYLPDPVQPFAQSNFEQQQIYDILPAGGNSHSGTGNLCVLDWVSNGRYANGEDWSFTRYGSRNEIYITQEGGRRRLLLRDNMLLDDGGATNSIRDRMDGQAVFGTLILHGSLLTSLGQSFMSEFKLLPRLGGRTWDNGSESGDEEPDPVAERRADRQRADDLAGVLWSAASIRDCVVVKFAAPAVEAGRNWLRTMLLEEGSVVQLFGDRALLCLR